MKPVKLSDVKRIKDSVLKGGDENGKKQNLETIGEEKMHKETRKRCLFDDEPSSPDQPLSHLTCFSTSNLSKSTSTSSSSSSSQESHCSTQNESDNASSSTMLTTSPARTESKEPQLKRPRTDNLPTDS